jgi:hypothetical protein
VQRVKIAIIVVGFPLAALILWRCYPREVVPNTPETKTLWRCTDKDCSHEFELTAKQVMDATMQGPPPIDCPKCKQKKAFSCQRCEKCGTVYFGVEVPGATGRCPKCEPEAKPPEPEPQPEEGQPAPRRKAPVM